MIVGIDLGTTNSLVSAMVNDKPVIIRNALKTKLTPSVVGLSEDNDIIVGEAARQRLTTHPSLTTACFKRYMGSDKKIHLGKKQLRAEELSALVLQSLKADAEAYFGETITDAVISVPAYFSDAQRKATKIAGELAGLNVQRLINEPTAAAIAYGLHKALDESTFIVIDLGGGTFDVSVLELFDGIMQVHASAGDNFLGGEDFSQAILQHFATRHGLNYQKLNSNERSVLNRIAENTKIALSDGQSVEMQLSLDGKKYASSINQSEFVTLVEPLLARLRTPIERAMRDAGLRTADLDALIMVGGACRMPIIKKTVSTMFGRLPHGQINVDETIALGAAIQAGLLDHNSALKEVVLTDVMPYSLGVDVCNPDSAKPGELIFSTIIERNSPVPISRVSTFYPVHEKQRLVEFGIYQGEARLVRDNIKLGAISLAIKSGDPDENPLNARFTYDINGLLEVQVEDERTGNQKRLIIEENPGVMGKQEIEKSLAALANLKIHPRTALENTTILARANRLFEENLGEVRSNIGEWISTFEVALEKQNPSEVDQARQALDNKLKHVDTEPF